MHDKQRESTATGCYIMAKLAIPVLVVPAGRGGREGRGGVTQRGVAPSPPEDLSSFRGCPPWAKCPIFSDVAGKIHSRSTSRIIPGGAWGGAVLPHQSHHSREGGGRSFSPCKANCTNQIQAEESGRVCLLGGITAAMQKEEGCFFCVFFCIKVIITA